MATTRRFPRVGTLTRAARGLARCLTPALAALSVLSVLAGPCGPCPARAAGRSLAIDAARVDAGCRAPVFARPDRGSTVVSRDTAVEYLVAGVISNAQGRWYEVIYPVRGWMREVDARFGPGGYNPESRSVGERVLLRLKSDIGSTPARWEKTMGEPWGGESWTETRGGGEAVLRVAAWPGVAVATERAAGEAEEAARIIRATMCGRARAGFGPYAVGEPGAVLRGLDSSFEPAPFAVFEGGGYRAALDEDGVISFIAWSADGEAFLGCPDLGAPEQAIPFYPGSIYPEAWCRASNLKVGLVAEGEYGGVDCDEDCVAEVRLDSGAVLGLFTSQEEAERWFGGGQGERVRAVYNIEQDWDPARRACTQTPVLQSGRVVDEEGRNVAAARRACRSMTVGQGEARGVLTVVPETEDGLWELLLDSDRPMSFEARQPFRKDGARPAEGTRVAVRYERVMRWDEEDASCAVRTVARQAPVPVPD